MAAPSSNGNGTIITGINVTPLVDLTLVLLIIFIVTARMIVTPAVPLELPRASQSEELQRVFSVTVPPHGPTLVDGQPASDDHLMRLAREALARDPALRAVIDADGEIPHRRVMRTLDLLKRAGIARIAFGVRPVDDGAD
jgi:biopolymer transport protein ExbD